MIEIDLRDLSRLEIQAERLRTPDTSELIGDLARKSLEQTRRRFRRRETPEGNPWPPRARTQRSTRFLEKSGRLLRSIRPRALQDDEFSLGTAGVPYACQCISTGMPSATSRHAHSLDGEPTTCWK